MNMNHIQLRSLAITFQLLIFWGTSLVVGVGPIRGQTALPTTRVNLLDDAQFQRGFIVWSPAPGRHVYQGIIQPLSPSETPVWGLAQWHSRFTLADAKAEPQTDGSMRYADGGKSVTLLSSADPADLSLALFGNIEYNQTPPAKGDPWPHLLATRKLAFQPTLTNLKSVPFRIRYRLVNHKVHRHKGFDERRHTAQFVFYVTVSNRNRQSNGFGDYYWFGIPIFDSRYRMSPGHMAIDKGSDRKPATGKFIFTLPSDRFTKQSAHDGSWVTIECDLLPKIREGLATAWERGYLPDSQNHSDYQLVSMNTGWEVTGTIDAEMQLAGLSLEAELLSHFEDASVGRQKSQK